MYSIARLTAAEPIAEKHGQIAEAAAAGEILDADEVQPRVGCSAGASLRLPRKIQFALLCGITSAPLLPNYIARARPGIPSHHFRVWGPNSRPIRPDKALRLADHLCILSD
jgi:hypothetical protein